MFARLATPIIKQFLGKYLENFEKQNLNVGISEGKINLNDVSVRVSTIQDEFKNLLPVTLKGIFVGELDVNIPWKNLSGEAIRITIRNVYAIASPPQRMKWDAKEEEKLKAAFRKSFLNALDNPTPTMQEQEEATPGFLKSLITKLIDNIQIDIENVHVRYENDGRGDHPHIAVGVLLEKLTILSTNEKFEPEFVSTAHKIIYKTLDLEKLSVYCKTKTTPMVFSNGKEMADQMKAILLNPEESHFILHPTSLIIKVKINKASKPDKKCPRIEASVELKQFLVTIQKHQYDHIMASVEYFLDSEKKKNIEDSIPMSQSKEMPDYGGNLQ